ncbi:ABC transporter permease [Mycoplasmatota bacterium zrk1]
MTNERSKYIKKIKKRKLSILATQIVLLIMFILVWEIAAKIGLIDSFITSSPSKILSTFIKSNDTVYTHIFQTLLEVMIGFILGTGLGFLIAIILWWSDFLNKVFDPYLVILNALPKVALGPIIIVWAGNGLKSIITMTVLISLVVTILNILSGFNEVDKDKIKLLESLGANKLQLLIKVIIPSNYPTIISTLKVTMGLTWVGVIMGEFLVSRAGLGHLIIYGSQVFQLDLVMMSIVLLGVLTSIMYFLLLYLESILIKYK